VTAQCQPHTVRPALAAGGSGQEGLAGPMGIGVAHADSSLVPARCGWCSRRRKSY